MHCLRRWMCVLMVLVSASVVAQQITGNIRGTVSDASGAVVQGATIPGKALNFYGQDTYKVTSRLTLNLGPRYELPFPYTELHNLQSLFVPGAQSKVFPSAPTGLLYPGDPGVPAGLIPTGKTAFAPRVGLAWDPTGDGKWLVSAAYGIFYEPFYNGQGGPLQEPISAPPYLATPQAAFPVKFRESLSTAALPLTGRSLSR